MDHTSSFGFYSLLREINHEIWDEFEYIGIDCALQLSSGIPASIEILIFFRICIQSSRQTLSP